MCRLSDGRLVQKRAEETNGPELDGEPEPHVIPTLGNGQLAIGIVEVEVPCKLVSRAIWTGPRKAARMWRACVMRTR